jgi:hypothetical protein
MCFIKVYFLFLFQDVLHTICAPNGQVVRIVIFKKNGVQAMVEYPFHQLYRACASHDVLHDVLADRRVNKRG